MQIKNISTYSKALISQSSSNAFIFRKVLLLLLLIIIISKIGIFVYAFWADCMAQVIKYLV